MVEASFLVDTIRGVVPGADVHPTDLAGGDHWFCVVVSPAFEGQRPLQRQRPILAAFTPHFQTGLIHALDLKCMTPLEHEQQGLPDAFRPHGPGEGSHPGAW